MFAVLIGLSVGIASRAHQEAGDSGIPQPGPASTACGIAERMGSDTSAKIYSDQRSLPIHLGDSGDGFTLPFKEKWRAPTLSPRCWASW